MADLADLKPSDRTIEILHPRTKQPVGLRVSIVSFTDDRVKKTRRRITDQKLSNDARNKSFKAEEVETNGNQMLFAAMTGWEWYNPTGSDGDKGYDPNADLTFHGEKPDFTPRNVFAVFDELIWVKVQIDTACAEDEAFFDNSKSN